MRYQYQYACGPKRVAGFAKGGVEMPQWTTWDWPFFGQAHAELSSRLSSWTLPGVDHEASDLEPACRTIARSLGAAGLIRTALPLPQADGAVRIDVRSLCLAREAVAYQSALADSVLAMQGIGSAAIWMHGTPALQRRYLEPIRNGEAIAAFALTEPATGSDVANIATRAEKSGDSYILNGEKTYISNAPFADHYIVVARTGEAPGAKGLTAFIVEAGTPGLAAGDPIELMAPHPVAPLRFENCRIPATSMLGLPGKGFGVAMSTFDVFRTSVGAAAVGMGRRALDEVLDRVRTRNLFGAAMSELQGVQSKLADMAMDIETAALTVYRAAWAKDTTGGRCSREASMAKFVGTEFASRVIDNAVQIFGGMGVTRGSMVEQLYREIRASRIYEGASEVQKIVIARDLLANRS